MKTGGASEAMLDITNRLVYVLVTVAQTRG